MRLRTHIIILLLLPLSIHANKYEEMYSKCVDENGPINNAVVDGCTYEVIEVVKKDMNRIYNIVYDKLSKESIDDANRLESAQKSWLKYRNAHCDLMGAYVGPPMYGYCPMGLNIARVMELEELAGE